MERERRINKSFDLIRKEKFHIRGYSKRPTFNILISRFHSNVISIKRKKWINALVKGKKGFSLELESRLFSRMRFIFNSVARHRSSFFLFPSSSTCVFPPHSGNTWPPRVLPFAGETRRNFVPRLKRNCTLRRSDETLQPDLC